MVSFFFFKSNLTNFYRYCKKFNRFFAKSVKHAKSEKIKFWYVANKMFTFKFKKRYKKIRVQNANLNYLKFFKFAQLSSTKKFILNRFSN